MDRNTSLQRAVEDAVFLWEVGMDWNRKQRGHSVETEGGGNPAYNGL